MINYVEDSKTALEVYRSVLTDFVDFFDTFGKSASILLLIMGAFYVIKAIVLLVFYDVDKSKNAANNRRRWYGFEINNRL